MKTKEINKIFKDYYEKHKTLMTLDGVVDEKDENILFILKESNTGNSKDVGIKDFWFKDVFSVKSINEKGYYEPKGVSLDRSKKGSQTKYYNCITKIKNKFDNEFGKDYGIFYINVNKEGGGKNSDGKRIKEWLTNKEKRDFLIKQISILAPDKVVVFSASTIGDGVIDVLLSANIADEDIVKMNFHPSIPSYKKINELFSGMK